ncbi:hypothetical protein SAMN04487980_10316 [Streptomyces sp. cf124]|nr:hypothetical protein SAMN04487980_10316 [Streptomyces sp. cf124]
MPTAIADAITPTERIRLMVIFIPECSFVADVAFTDIGPWKIYNEYARGDVEAMSRDLRYI